LPPPHSRATRNSRPVRLRSYALAFSLIAAFLIFSHSGLLDLPFYWDETGQFVPAALDVFRAGKWIPASTVPNVHPPGVMAYLAAVWSVFGYSIVVTRVAMLLVAAFGATAAFLLAIELGRGAPGTPGFAALALLCFSPLFFAQSMLAQLDMPAMAVGTLALLLFLQSRWRASAIACTVLVLVKETGAVVPAVFACWLLAERRDYRNSVWFLIPFPALLIWLFALHHATGHWFGSSEFAAYNISDALNPAHILVALARRFYYLFIGSGHFIGTAALILAWRRMPLLRDRSWRIAWAFLFAQVLVVSALGGATLERYLLPVIPVVYIAFAISLRAPGAHRQIGLAALVVCLIAANFVNPVYPFPFENNLAFTDFVHIEQSAVSLVEHDGLALPGGGLIGTAFPVSNALRNPALGYIGVRHHVFDVPGFTRRDVAELARYTPDMVIVPPRAWDPFHLLDHPIVAGFLTRVWGYEPELTADEIATALSMRVTHRFNRRGLSMALLER